MPTDAVNVLPPSAPGAVDKLLTRDYALACLASIVVFTGWYFLLPTLPLYVKDLGGKDVELGLATAVLSVSTVASRLLAGRAADKWGRKWLLVAGTFVFLVSMVAFAFTTDVLSVLLVRFLQGFGFGTMTAAGGTLVADLAPERRRGEAVGYYGMFMTIAMAIGPGVGLSLLVYRGLPIAGFQLLFVLAAVLAALSLVVTLLIREPREALEPHAESAGSPSARGFFVPAVLPLALALLLITPTYGAVLTFLPVHAGPQQTQNVSVFFLVYALVVLVSRPAAGLLADRIGRRPVLIPATALAAIGVGLLAMPPDLPVVVAAALCYGAGFGAIYPSILALALDRVSPRQRGSAMGLMFAAFDAGIALGTMLFALVAELAGYGATFLGASGIAFIALAYILLYPRYRP